MCLGLPGRIVEIQPGGEVARVDVAGVLRDINIALLDGPFVPGDYLLIHSGFAVERMSPDAARDALDVFAEGAGPAGGTPAEGIGP